MATSLQEEIGSEITLAKDLLFNNDDQDLQNSPTKDQLDFSEITIDTEASSTIGISNETPIINEEVKYEGVSGEKETHIEKPFEGEFTLEEPFTTTLLRDLKIVYHKLRFV